MLEGAEFNGEAISLLAAGRSLRDLQELKAPPLNLLFA